MNKDKKRTGLYFMLSPFLIVGIQLIEKVKLIEMLALMFILWLGTELYINN